MIPAGPVMGVPNLQVRKYQQALAEGREIAVYQHRLIKQLSGELERLRAMVIDLAGDRDYSDPSKMVHTISKERLAKFDEQKIRCTAMPRPDHSAIDLYVWTGEAGDAHNAELRKKLAEYDGPIAEVEVVRDVETIAAVQQPTVDP